ncbi:MAG: hypothetical protein KGL12_03200, partial [Rhodospirillales bacterium]|nr:hypothetical protein [Rhodospirillales bacterium]
MALRRTSRECPPEWRRARADLTAIMFEPELSAIGNTMRRIGDLSPRPPVAAMLARLPMPARPPWPLWPLTLAVAGADAAALAVAAHAVRPGDAAAL